MNFLLCHCGAAPGYLHDAACPYPLFGDSPASVREWHVARAQRRHTLLLQAAQLVLRQHDAAPGEPIDWHVLRNAVVVATTD